MPSTNATGHAFGRTLADLKRRGSSLLVLGPRAPFLRRAASRRLLGDGAAETRRRLFVLTDGAATTPEVAVGPATPETTRVVEWSNAVTTRSAATAGDPIDGFAPPGGPPATERVGDAAADYPRRSARDGRLGSLAAVVGDEIDALERQATSFDPGELRICVDSLDPMLATNEVGEVRRLVGAVARRVRSVSGMAHYHLSAERSDAVVERLEPSFDAVIELRFGADDDPQHRWTFPGRDVESEWLEL